MMTPVRLSGFFAAIIVACLALGEDRSVEERVAEYRRETTNLQFNTDGAVDLIRLSKPTVENETLEKLLLFPHLKYLAIIAPNVTDDGIWHIAKLKELDTLLVSETGITARGLESLQGLVHLERISLTKLSLNRIPDDAFDELEKVVSLSLAETQIDDSAISEICKLKTLESLTLDNTLVTDVGLEQIGGLPNLKLLSLCGCEITGSGFTSFSQSNSVENLVLSRSGLDDDGLKQIARIASLDTVEIHHTKVSADGVDQLRKSLPQTTVFFSATKSTTNDPEQTTIDVGEDDTRDLSPIQAPIDQRISDQRISDQRISDQLVPDFQRHVIPLLGRLGCNSRNCHGSFQGRGGFRLSMFGYDFDLDHENLSERIDTDDPADSLIVNKPTWEDDHEGGKRFEIGSWQQTLLRRWIALGAKNRPADAATFVRLDVEPKAIVFKTSSETKQLRVVAVWSDGSREDVTPLTRFETKDDVVAAVDENGLVTAKGPGDTHVIAYYDNGIHPIQVILPVRDPNLVDFDNVPSQSRIDEFVVAKLKKLGVKPSKVSTDEMFLRRVSLDMIGSLPTPQEIRTFVDDTDRDKRTRKIDELLERPAYVAWWTNRLCDLTGANAGYLGGTEMARPVSLQWQAWIERRVRDNVGWDTIACDLITSTSRRLGQTYREFAKEQSEFTRRVDPTDFAAADNPMPHYWYRSNITIPSDKALSFGYIFMGLRLDCAQCHKHPFDRWSQNDFELFTEFFTRIKTGLAPDAVSVHEDLRQSLGVPVKLDTAALRRQSYMRIAAEGRPIPWREVWIEPSDGKHQTAKLLGAAEMDLSVVDDPRVPLANWLRTEPNRYMAKAFVNRIWSNYFGIGIVNPTDDLNLANPPSHPELIEYLADQFVQHGYDMKWLHRTITNSRTYQLSWKPTESNVADLSNYSHATLRRLPAEVAVDAIYQATANNKVIMSLGRDVGKRKISQHPKSYQTRSIDYSLLVFGKSLRTANCDCERNLSPTLPQALYLRNDSELLGLIDRKDGWIEEIANLKESPDAKKLVEEAYLRTLSRLPTEQESKTGIDHFDDASHDVDAARDLLWALINTQEFIANH